MQNLIKLVTKQQQCLMSWERVVFGLNSFVWFSLLPTHPFPICCYGNQLAIKYTITGYMWGAQLTYSNNKLSCITATNRATVIYMLPGYSSIALPTRWRKNLIQEILPCQFQPVDIKIQKQTSLCMLLENIWHFLKNVIRE